MPPEQLLVKELLRNYVKQGRPKWNAGETIHVNISLALQQITNLDERTQKLITRGWLEVASCIGL